MQDVIHRKYNTIGPVTQPQINLLFHHVMQIIYHIMSQTTLAPGEITKEVKEHLDAYLTIATITVPAKHHRKPGHLIIKECKCNSELHSLSEF